MRRLEFDSWLNDCRSERLILSSLTSIFVGILGFFTLILCLITSASFTNMQCMLWVETVAQSIALQVRVVCTLHATMICVVSDDHCAIFVH